MRRIFICFFILLFSVTVQAEKFNITNYNIHLNVQSDKSIVVTKDIKAHFNVPQRGILHYVPTSNGEKLSNIAASDKPIVSTDKNYTIIKMGNKSGNPITGDYDYKLQYTHHLTGQTDRMFLFLAESGPTTVQVVMPKDFADNAVRFVIIDGGVKEQLIPTRNGNTLTAVLNRQLTGKEALYLSGTFGEDYFTGAHLIPALPQQQNHVISVKQPLARANSTSSSPAVQTQQKKSHPDVGSEKFYIQKYDVKLNVDENKAVHITETIDVYFVRSAHGIIREIPIDFREKLTMESISEKYTQNYAFADSTVFVNYKIGHENILQKDHHKYVLKFTHEIPYNPNELFYNLVGTGWGVPIEKVSFSIKMPEVISKSDVVFYVGHSGSKFGQEDVSYTINNNHITGETTRMLNKYEGVSVKINVPDGYFNIPSPFKNNPLRALGVFMFAILAFLAWFFYGKNKYSQAPIISFYPPQNCGAIECSVLDALSVEKTITGIESANGENKGFLATLILLASKGYIKIEKIASGIKPDAFATTVASLSDSGTRLKNKFLQMIIMFVAVVLFTIPFIGPVLGFIAVAFVIFLNVSNKNKDRVALSAMDQLEEDKKDEFMLHKLKEYEGTDEFEKRFMELLFPNDATSVSSKVLGRKPSFFLNMHRALSKSEKSFFKKYGQQNLLLSYFFGTVGTIATYFVWQTVFPIRFSWICVAVLIVLLIISGFIENSLTSNSSKLIRGIVTVIWASFPVIVGPIVLSLLYGKEYFNMNEYFVVGLLAIVIMRCSSRYMMNITKIGAERISQAMGFKRFLETAELPEVQKMLVSNPNYGFDIMPYLYIFGLEEKWMKKFAPIFRQTPEWYQGAGKFSMHGLRQVSRSFSPPVSSGSRGGRSRSGGSGGGSGGGGGRSW